MLESQHQQRTCPKVGVPPVSTVVHRARTGQTFSGGFQPLREGEAKANAPCPRQLARTIQVRYRDVPLTRQTTFPTSSATSNAPE